MRTELHAVAGVAIGLLSALTHAQNILSAEYDPSTDRIVAVVAYQGTNPNHTFALKWDECKSVGTGDETQVAALLEDRQWDDAAEREFKKKIALSLKSIPCRPAQVSLHTAAGFVYTLQVPVAPNNSK